MPSLSLRLPDELEHRPENEARRAGVPRSEVARMAISEFLARRERERFMSEMVAEARTAYANEDLRGEALGLEKDFLDLDAQKKNQSTGQDDPEESWWK